jgi:hypothetical protein
VVNMSDNAEIANIIHWDFYFQAAKIR